MTVLRAFVFTHLCVVHVLIHVTIVFAHVQLEAFGFWIRVTSRAGPAPFEANIAQDLGVHHRGIAAPRLDRLFRSAGGALPQPSMVGGGAQSGGGEIFSAPYGRQPSLELSEHGP